MFSVDIILPKCMFSVDTILPKYVFSVDTILPKYILYLKIKNAIWISNSNFYREMRYILSAFFSCLCCIIPQVFFMIRNFFLAFLRFKTGWKVTINWDSFFGGLRFGDTLTNLFTLTPRPSYRGDSYSIPNTGLQF